MMIENKIGITEKVYIIKPIFDKNQKDDIDEIISLVKTAGGDVVGVKKQLIRAVNPSTFLGKGKLEEIYREFEDNEVNLVVFDGELSPSQTLNLSFALGGVKVIDRTTLILDIFALHAQSAEGKIQVELAQLKYIYPRLKGKGSALSQQGAGIGTRGPGETQLETDRRHIRLRIKNLESALEEMEKTRELQSYRRKKQNTKIVALVGYTNTGKSTLLNALTGSDVLAEDKLFATLDPTSRKLVLEDTEVILVDTVGFLKNIPHNLIESFKSTLESALDADLILNVCDATDDYEKQLEVTNSTLEDLHCEGEIITVINKCESINDLTVFPEDYIPISAKYGIGLQNLKKRINDYFKNLYINKNLIIPYVEYNQINNLEKIINIKNIEYRDNGVYIQASVPNAHFERIKKYVVYD